MTDRTPELVAGPKPPEVARERGFAPLGWLSSGVVHSAALVAALVYADLIDRRNTTESQEVVVDVVVDIPIQQALPSSAAPRPLAQSPNAAQPEPARAVGPGAALSAASLPDRAVPVSASPPAAAATRPDAATPAAADAVMAEAVPGPAAARPVEATDGLAIAPALPAGEPHAPVAALEQAAAPAAPSPDEAREPVHASPALPAVAQPETVHAASEPSVAVASLAPSAEAPSPPPPAIRNGPSAAPEPLPPATEIRASSLTPRAEPALSPAAGGAPLAFAASSPARVAALPSVIAATIDARPVTSAPPAASAAGAPSSFASSTVEHPPAPAAARREQRPEREQLASIILPQRSEARGVDPQHELAIAVGGLDCARVQARIEPGTGAAVLSGHIRSERDRDRLVRQVSAIPGVRTVRESALQVVGDPYCRVLTLLGRPDFVRSEDQRQDLAEIGTAAEAGIARFEGGSALDMPLSAPKFPSYIYVDYFTADGRVYHLLPSDDPLGNKFAPDERFRVGGRNGRGRSAFIAPPYGLDMIVAIAASEPIFVKTRPMVENASDYLLSLNFAVSEMQERGRKLNVEYAYYLVYTAPAKNASN